jgi:hypothetical protein
MRVFATLSACGALAATSLVSADFVGFQSDGWYGVNLDGSTGVIGSTDYCVIDIYAQFDINESDGYSHADSTVLSIFDANVSMSDSRDFQHNDVVAGSWNPGFSLDLPGNGSLPWVDSFVTIGSQPGALNSTTLDPNFNPSNTGEVPVGAGWYTGSPADLDGRVNASLRTFVGRFVVDTAGAIGESISFDSQMSYNYGIGTGTFFGQGSDSWDIIPAPSALALLGIAGVISRRRRH